MAASNSEETPDVGKDDLGKYSDTPQAIARFVAQQLIMKPYVWSALSVHVHGDRHLKELNAPFIVIANHSSHVDTTVIYGACRRRLLLQEEDLRPGHPHLLQRLPRRPRRHAWPRGSVGPVAR
jgi:hypothetical protein